MLTRFTKKQLHKLSVILDNVILPKMGINRKMARAVVYGPLDFGGMAYPSMSTIQDVKGISHFIKHLQWNKEVGTDLRLLLSAAQIHSGLTTHLMDNVTDHLTYLEDGHIAHLRERLRQLGGGIWIENAWVPDLQREHDESIMGAFIKVKTKGASKARLENANLCRMYARVITVAELTDMNGRTISPERLDGRWRATSSLRWPNQIPPTRKMWNDFRYYVRASICSNAGRVWRTSTFTLNKPLGSWIKSTRHVQYDIYRTPLWIYRQDTDGPEPIITRYQQSSNLANSYHEDAEVANIPDHAHPIDARIKRSVLYPHHEYKLIVPQPPEAPLDIESLHPERIKSAKRLTSVSDGSLDPITGRAAFAWILALPGKEAWIKRRHTVNANPKYVTSFRAEIAGICDLLKYSVKERMFDTEFEIWCDNKACLDVLRPDREPMLADLTDAESDLIAVARNMLRQLKKVTVHHVLGHQEDNVPYEDLPYEAQLNIDCDAEAKECMWSSEISNIRPDPTEGAGAILYLGNEMVTTEMKEQIEYAAHAPDMFTYLRGKYEWTDNQLHSINWKALRLAKRRLTRRASIRTSKMLHEWLNVGRQKAKLQQDSTCPCCGLEEEDQVHLYHCSHAGMRSTIEEEINTMEKNLHKANVPVSTSIAFIDMVRMATHSTRQRKQYHCHEAEAATRAQESLGTFAITRGHHHIQWAHAVMKTYKKRASPPTTDAKKKKRRDKTPLEMSVYLIEECWRLFEQVWKTRNDILHSSDSYTAAAQNALHTRRLLYYRMRQDDLLHYGDRHHIDYPTHVILSWNRKRKKNLLRLLDKFHKIYKQDIRLAAEGQTKLEDYRDYFILPSLDGGD